MAILSAGREPVVAPDGEVVRKAERDVWRTYFARQFTILTQRHSPEDAILLRVIADFHHDAVLKAKEGRFQAARSTLRTLQNMAELGEPELRSVFRVSSLPVWALLHWYEEDHHEAIRLLKQALDACLELAIQFGHDYLTAKQIHLAANIARVVVSLGSLDCALARVAALKAVVAGDRARWPYEGPEWLNVPLTDPDRFMIEEQLARVASMTVK